MNKNFAILGAAVLSLGLVACDEPADQVEEGDTTVVVEEPATGGARPSDGPVPEDN